MALVIVHAVKREEGRMLTYRLGLLSLGLLALLALIFALTSCTLPTAPVPTPPSVITRAVEARPLTPTLEVATLPAEQPGTPQPETTAQVSQPTLTLSPEPTATPPPEEGTPVGPFTLSPQQASNIPGVTAGVTEDGAPFRGDPQAPVVMVEYSDFQCPFCERHFQQTQPQLDETYVKEGKVRHVFKNFPLTSIHPQAIPAAQAALCAGVQGQFWPMHDLLFARQSEWAGNDQAAEVFRQFARELELDMDQYDACWAAQPFSEQIQAELSEGIERGVSGTPAFFINDWFISGAQPLAVFQSTIENALAGKHPEPTATPSYADLHPFDPDPETPYRTYLGDAYIGSEDAPVVILEVSDLLCPWCQRHHTSVWPEFREKYVDTGQVRVVFKHFLGHQPNSEVAGEAAECAGNQGAFFAYADLLYERMDEWKLEQGDALADRLKAYAQEMGLDTASFNTCLDTHEMREKVRNDHRVMVQIGVQGTPTFIIIYRNRSLGRVPGFISMEQWDEVMDQVMALIETP